MATAPNRTDPREGSGNAPVVLGAVAAFLLSGAAILSLGFSAIPGVVLGVEVLKARPASWIRAIATVSLIVGIVGLVLWGFAVAMVFDGSWCLIPDVEPACPRPGLAALSVAVGLLLAAATWFGAKPLLTPRTCRWLTGAVTDR